MVRNPNQGYPGGTNSGYTSGQYGGGTGGGGAGAAGEVVPNPKTAAGAGGIE